MFVHCKQAWILNVCEYLHAPDIQHWRNTTKNSNHINETWVWKMVLHRDMCFAAGICVAIDMADVLGMTYRNMFLESKTSTLLSSILNGQISNFPRYLISVRKSYPLHYLQNLMRLLILYYKVNDTLFNQEYCILSKWALIFDLEEIAKFWMMEGIKKGQTDCYRKLLNTHLFKSQMELQSISSLACTYCPFRQIMQIFVEEQYPYLYTDFRFCILSKYEFDDIPNILSSWNRHYDMDSEIAQCEECISKIVQFICNDECKQHLLKLQTRLASISSPFKIQKTAVFVA